MISIAAALLLAVSPASDDHLAIPTGNVSGGAVTRIDSARFELSFPDACAVTYSSDTTVDQFGRLIVQTYQIECGSVLPGADVLQMTITDMPFPITSRADMDTMLAGTLFGSVQPFDSSSIISKGRMDGEFYRGVVMSASASYKGMKRFLRYRWTMVGPRLYTLTFWSKEERWLTDPAVDAFFASFVPKK